MAIGDNLDRRLKQKGWTKSRFAQEMHVTPEAVYKWMKGERTPNAYALYRMAKILRCPMEALVEGIEDEKEN